MPPIILNSGQNYWDHRDEKPEVDQQDPEFFLKAPLAVIGPDEPVIHDPVVTQKLDYEVELAVIIGKPGRHIPKDKALEHVFGYTVANDITARDRQAVPHPEGGFEYRLGPGKNFDTAAPLGLDRDARRDRRPAGSGGSHLRQRRAPPEQLDREDDLGRRDARGVLLALLHAPAGRGARDRDPGGTAWATDPEIGGKPYDRSDVVRGGYLKAGDRVTVEVDGIGSLSNPIVQAP